MRTTTLLLFGLFGFFSSYGQEISPDSVRKLIAIYKPLLESDTIDLAQRRVFKLKGDLFKVEDRYVGKTLASVTYTQEIPFTRHLQKFNDRSEFFETGKIQKMIVKSEKDSLRMIKEFFASGNTYRIYEINYLDGSVTMGSVFDTSGRELVSEGSGKSAEVNFYMDKFHVEFGSYKDGRKIGTWKGFYENGERYYSENFNEKGLVSGVAYDTEGNEYFYTEEEITPKFEGGKDKLNRFMAKNISYPKYLNNNNAVERVRFSFAIEKDGSISEVVDGSDGVYPLFVRETKKVIRSMSGKWIPGKKRGIPVKMYYLLPFTFKMY